MEDQKEISAVQPMQVATETPELIAALCKAQAMFKPALKDADNPFFKSKYADLNAVWDACKEGLHTNGLFVSQQLNTRTGGTTWLRTRVYHASGGYIESEVQVIVTKQNDPQSYGSAVTYFRRYSLGAILGVVTDDDDGEAAMSRDSKPAQQQAAKPRQMTAEQKEEILDLLKNPAQSEESVKKVTSNLNSLDYDTALKTTIYLKKQIATAAAPQAKEASHAS